MSLFRYYGLDWLIFVFFAIHTWLLGSKQKSAFIFGMLGCGCGLIFATMIDSLASGVMNCLFLFMHVRAYLLWNKE